MLCPACKTPLSMTDRSGIEIDFCPSCRGVWLDRGELDKIIDRAAAPAGVPSSSYSAPYAHAPNYRHRKKKSFLSEMFDFD